jgi:hypothetical protein
VTRRRRGGEDEFRAGGGAGAGDGGWRAPVRDDGRAGFESGRARLGFAAELWVVGTEDRAPGGRDHPALAGGEQGVLVPDAFGREAGAAENRDFGVGGREGLIAERAAEDAEAARDASAGNGGIEGPGFGEEAGDGNRVGDDL